MGSSFSCREKDVDKKEKNKLEKFLTDYFKSIHKVYTDGDFREESFYPSTEVWEYQIGAYQVME